MDSIARSHNPDEQVRDIAIPTFQCSLHVVPYLDPRRQFLGPTPSSTHEVCITDLLSSFPGRKPDLEVIVSGLDGMMSSTPMHLMSTIIGAYIEEAEKREDHLLGCIPEGN